jgi:hypothetical protein
MNSGSSVAGTKVKGDTGTGNPGVEARNGFKLTGNGFKLTGNGFSEAAPTVRLVFSITLVFRSGHALNLSKFVGLVGMYMYINFIVEKSIPKIGLFL